MAALRRSLLSLRYDFNLNPLSLFLTFELQSAKKTESSEKKSEAAPAGDDDKKDESGVKKRK